MSKQKAVLLTLINERIDQTVIIIQENEKKLNEAESEERMQSEIKLLIVAFLKAAIVHDKERKYHYLLMRDSIIAINESEKNHKEVYEQFLRKIHGYDN